MVMPQTIEAASLGMWDSLLLMLLALVVLGPRRLPEIGRQIGKLMYEVRKASNDFKFQMEEELRKSEDADRKNREQGTTNSEQIPALALNADSHIPESEAEAPSPYPAEAVYPAVSPGEFHPNEPTPRIQPPSTGEPVAAEPPGRMASRLELPTTATTSETPGDQHLLRTRIDSGYDFR
jgi:sec-independent protein translocase protein TatB